MATLEKIRSKSVFLLIIIAVALLAFILGDFLTSGRTFFGTGTTIAKVDGQKIDVMEFQKRVEAAQQQAQARGRQIDGAVLQQQVLDQMIEEQLMEREFNQLGIDVTDKELSDMLLGQNSFYFDRVVQQNTGLESAVQLYDMAHNPAKYQLDAQQADQLKKAWLEMENDAAKGLKYQKFQTLFSGALQANKLDAKALYEEGRTTATLAYARKDFASVPDENYEVSDKEINDEWGTRKNRYVLDEPTRVVGYISVDVQPSPEDLAAARADVNKAVQGLRTQQGTEGLEGMTKFLAERKSLAAGDISDKRLESWLDSAAIGSAGVVSVTGNDYLLAKLLSTGMQTDKVVIDFLALQAPRAEIDSMVRALNAGAISFADVAANAAAVGSQDSTEVSLINPQMAPLKSTLLEAATGVWFTPDTLADGGRIFRVRSRQAPVKVYDIAEIVYVAEPSSATINKLEADLSRYVKENATAAAFEENAAAAGYNVRSAQVTASSPRLGNLDDSRDMVAWVMDAKKGAVSNVFGEETVGRFAAVAVNDIYNAGYTPATDKNVREELTRRVRNHRKAADLAKQYEGKANDVAGYAAVMGASVDTTTVNFSQMFTRGIGVNEGALTAKALTAKQGELVGPVETQNGIIFFEVVSTEENPRPYDEKEAMQQFNGQRASGALGRNISKIVRGNKTVKNNMLKFYGK